MKVVIVAAGMGSRLWDKTDKTPKTLLPLGGGTILSTIMGNFSQVGINDFVIVVGWQSDFIIKYLKENQGFGYNIATVKNDLWNKGNGISVLVSEPETKGENFILSMSDHIVSIGALERIINFQSDKNLLLVDPKCEEVFDIDDATKVQCNGNSIVNIGKKIKKYNALDCGVFRLNRRYYSAMREALEKGEDSISAAINRLIANNDMEAVFVERDESWLDIDTPEAYKHYLENSKF
ncbi:MAG: sugar phosphate nucleotidyltransferase [Candidatus Zixiibacteriota bacterium]